MSIIIGLCFDENLNLLNDYLCSIEKIYIKLLDLKLNSEFDENDYQYMKEQQSLQIENTLGICFILVQNFITSIVSSSNRFIHQFPEYRSVNIKKSRLVGSTFSKIIPEFNCTKIETFDAIANYYKHNDEWICRWHNNWHDDWQNKKANVRKTIEIVEALSMNPQKNNNIQYACEKMKLHKGKIFIELYESLELWSKKIAKTDKKNLISLAN